jgi:hypothetical protein
MCSETLICREYQYVLFKNSGPYLFKCSQVTNLTHVTAGVCFTRRFGLEKRLKQRENRPMAAAILELQFTLVFPTCSLLYP